MIKRKPYAKRVDKNKAEAMDRKNSYDKMKVATNRNRKNIGGVQMDDLSLTHCKYEYKKIEILEAETCTDHIHMLITFPPKYSVSQVVGYLKGKSSLMIFDKFANLKYKYGNRHFWCKGYYVSTVT